MVTTEKVGFDWVTTDSDIQKHLGRIRGFLSLSQAKPEVGAQTKADQKGKKCICITKCVDVVICILLKATLLCSNIIIMLGTSHLNAFSIDTLCPHLNETKVLQISSFKMWHSCQSVWFFVIWHTVCYMNLLHILLSTFITYLILMYAIIVTVISVYITKMEAKLFLQAKNLLLTAKKQCILGVQHAFLSFNPIKVGEGSSGPRSHGRVFWPRNHMK